MKSQIALLGLLALTAISGVLLNSSLESNTFLQEAQDMDFEAYQEFLVWKAENGKNYDMQNDELYRFTVFAENLDFVKQHNKANKSTVTLKMTPFADLTNQEFVAKMTTNVLSDEEDDVDTVIPKDTKKYENIKKADWQDISWVQKGAVTSVKNQGSCGGCWAFASTASLETLRYSTEGVLESLSNQQMLSCAPVPIFGAGGCNGGNSYYAYDYSQKTKLVTEADVPYKNGDSGKTLACTVTQQQAEAQGVFSNKSQANVTKNNPAAMYSALQNYVQYISINGGSIYFQLYGGGVLDNTGCTAQTNHAVALVAYSSSDNAWTIKNSWGTGWGEQGFARIAVVEGKGICGMNTKPAYPSA